MYNTTYVTVYDSTPEVVYVGYTPGYMWSYPYYGVPIYGTGWYYPPYYGRYYYPRAPTWGFHVGYNPWTGWNFGVSWGGPFFRVGVVWGGGYGHGYHPGRCCGGRYGGGYHHNNININTGDINIGNNINVGNRNKIGNRVSDSSRRSNIYNDTSNRSRNADKATVRSNMKTARVNTDRKNDLYASKGGQVARRDANDWQVRENNKWQTVDRSKPETGNKARPAVSPSSRNVQPATMPDRNKVQPTSMPNRSRVEPRQQPQFDHKRMDRDFNARSRGAQRGGGRRGR